MRDEYRLRPRPIEFERHPRWATHYIQEIEIVENATGRVVETIEAFDTDGCSAVQQARKRALAWIAQKSEEGEAPTVGRASGTGRTGRSVSVHHNNPCQHRIMV
jgi:hypothetical protein